MMNSAAWVESGEKILLSGILGISVIGKTMQGPRQRVRDVEGYQILPKQVSFVAAQGLLVTEAILASALFIGFQRKWAAVATAALFLSFALAIESALARGLVTNCGCFGTLAKERVSHALAIRDLLLAGIALRHAWR